MAVTGGTAAGRTDPGADSRPGSGVGSKRHWRENRDLMHLQIHCTIYMRVTMGEAEVRMTKGGCVSLSITEI